jgi:hypothetical protein
MVKCVRVAAAALLALLLGASPRRQQQPDLGIAVFPSDNPWNWDITGLAVHPNSANYITTIGALTPIREDYAFHYSVVLDAQSNVDVAFNQFEDESDPGPGFGSPPDGTLSTGSKGSYPIPSTAQIEPGGDAHVLVIDKDNALLYETYATAGPPWTAGCGAVFNLASNAVRPEGWTSGDAAGLPIFPGLIRYEEVAAGQINHALRFTCSPTQNAHLYPARHHAGVAGANNPPMGLRVRLKASKDISGYTGAARVILEALKKHGLILADNGSDWYISTTLDTRWSSTNITQIRNMVGSDFEVVVSVDGAGAPILPVSGGGTGPPPPPGPPPGGGAGGGGGGGGCGLSGRERLLVWAGLWIRRR